MLGFSFAFVHDFYILWELDANFLWFFQICLNDQFTINCSLQSMNAFWWRINNVNSNTTDKRWDESDRMNKYSKISRLYIFGFTKIWTLNTQFEKNSVRSTWTALRSVRTLNTSNMQRTTMPFRIEYIEYTLQRHYNSSRSSSSSSFNQIYKFT